MTYSKEKSNPDSRNSISRHGDFETIIEFRYGTSPQQRSQEVGTKIAIAELVPVDSLRQIFKILKTPVPVLFLNKTFLLPVQ